MKIKLSEACRRALGVVSTMTLFWGCASKSARLSKEYVVTSSAMVSPEQAPWGAKDKSWDKAVSNILNQSYCLYQVNQKGGTNYVHSLKLEGAVLEITSDPKLDFNSKSQFAAASEANISYAGILSARETLGYDYLREIMLTRDDPQFSIQFHVDPEVLLRHQLDLAPEVNTVVLFQKYIFAPYFAQEKKLKNSASNVDTIIAHMSDDFFEGQIITLSKRLIFRKYENANYAQTLLQTSTPMFVPLIDTNGVSLSNGSKNVDPDNLRYKFRNQIYKISDPYQNHLKAEGVSFNCPPYPEKRSPKR